ncbi:MAG: stage II sporulation protein M [Oscillospiraceae bacterium]|nr:stage II sporulation protein M [Oscillospiraceae bacterium]
MSLLGLFALGLFLGARTAGGADHAWQTQLVTLLRQQSQLRDGRSLLGNVAAYLNHDILFLLAAYLLGLCAAGLPLLLLLPLLRGLGLGVVSGWLYFSEGLRGLGYSILVQYPAAVISMLILLAAAKEGMLMAGDMLLTVTGKQERVESGIRMYSLRFLVLAVLCVPAALLDALCFSAFSGLFAS